MLWDLLERLVDWGEHGVVRKCAIQEGDNIFVFVDQSSQLGGIFARSDQFLLTVSIVGISGG